MSGAARARRRARLAASVSSRFVITACAAHVSAAASRRFRISFSVFKISMVASRTCRRAKLSGMARDLNVGMTTLRHVDIKRSG